MNNLFLFEINVNRIPNDFSLDNSLIHNLESFCLFIFNPKYMIFMFIYKCGFPHFECQLLR